jgi:NAD(P)-dependent dehydrogenase (short-subunit alcohol dehydrogenase family)
MTGLIDTLMDRTVVPGYTTVGYRLRRRLGTQGEIDVSMTGRSVLVTGATSGLGLAAATGFARLGATVHLLARDAARGERARQQVDAAGPATAHVHLADLSALRSVRSFARSFLESGHDLHVLVNNAGVLRGERELSEDGIELTFATDVLGPFLLTNMLLARLRECAPARVVNVSSGGMYTQRLDVGDLQFARRDYDGPAAYAAAKRALVVLTEIWAQRLAGSGVVVHSMHPGWAATPGVETSLPRFHRVMGPLLRTPEEGADTIVWLGAAPEPERDSGRFWHDRRPRPTHRVPWTRERPGDRGRLWQECCRLSGWDDTSRR